MAAPPRSGRRCPRRTRRRAARAGRASRPGRKSWAAPRVRSRSGRAAGRAGAPRRLPQRWRNGRPWAAGTIGATAPGRQADPTAGPDGQRLLGACRWKLRAPRLPRIAPMPAAETLTVVLADDHEVVRSGLGCCSSPSPARGGGRGRCGLGRDRGGHAPDVLVPTCTCRASQPAGDPAPGRAEPADAVVVLTPSATRASPGGMRLGTAATCPRRPASSCAGRSASPPRAAPTWSRGSGAPGRRHRSGPPLRARADRPRDRGAAPDARGHQSRDRRAAVPVGADDRGPPRPHQQAGLLRRAPRGLRARARPGRGVELPG